MLLRSLIPWANTENIRQAVRYLCWRPANLGGYSFTRADVMAMPWDEVDDHMASAGVRRQKEIQAANTSAPGKRR